MTRLTSTQAEFVESVLRLKPLVAAFDCDGTLWSGDAGEGFFYWELQRGLIPAKIAQSIRSRHADYRAGLVDEDTMCGEMVTMHRGLREEVVQEACDAYFKAEIGDGIFPEMRQLVERLRQSGCDVWAVSSSNQWVIRSGMRYFGIPPNRILAVEAEVENGDRSHDHRPAHPDSQRARQGGGASVGSEIFPRPTALLATRFGTARCSPCPASVRHQPQSEFERDRNR